MQQKQQQHLPGKTEMMHLIHTNWNHILDEG